MTLFRFLFAIDALFVLIVGFLFVSGLQYNPSASALAPYALFLGLPIVMLAGGWMLQATGKRAAANWLLGVLALAPLLNVLYIVAVLLMTKDMH